MSELDDVKRQLGVLDRQVDDIRTESRRNDATLATAIRKTRQQIDVAELQASIRRGRPSAATRLWDPRAGEFVSPDLATSLISRLRRGDSVSNTLGEAQPSGIGLRNFFTDARLTSVGSVSTSLLSGVLTRVANDWSAILAAGTTGVGTADVRLEQFLDDALSNPLETADMVINLENWTAAGTATVKFKAGLIAPAFDPEVMPFVVFSSTIYKDISVNQLFDNVTSCEVKLVIRDSADAATLVESPPLDFLNMGDGAYLRMWAPLASSAWSATLRPQLWVTLVTSAASGPGLGQFEVSIGNPMFELSPYQYPSPFRPEPMGSLTEVFLATGAGDDAHKILLRGETNVKLALGLSSADEGAVIWGSGGIGSPDLRLRRTAASVLRLDNNSTGRATLEAYAGTAPATPGAGLGRMYFSSATKTWHQVDDAGVDKDLYNVGGGGGLPGGGVAGSAHVGIAGAAGVAVTAAESDHQHPAIINLFSTAGAGTNVVEQGITGDAQKRLILRLTSADGAQILMGPGGAGAQDINISRAGAALERHVNEIQAERAAAANPAFSTQVTADAQKRLIVGADGAHEWGSGAAVADLSLSRGAAGQMIVNADGTANPTLFDVRSTAGQTSRIRAYVTADAAARFDAEGDATFTGIRLGGGAAAADLRVFRSAAGKPVIDSNSAATATQVVIESTAGQVPFLDIQIAGDTNPRVRLRGDTSGINWSSGAAATDLRAYRSAAKVLTIDDNVGGAVTVNVLGTLQEGGFRVVTQGLADAKGDVLAATAADTIIRLAVGANDTVLMADSTQATGLKYGLPVRRNASVADQGIAAATSAYLTGSSIAVPAGLLRIGTVFRWRLHMSKTAAATVAGLAFIVRIGTAGTVADAAVLTFTQAQLQTGVVDDGDVDVIVTIRGPLGAACLAQGAYNMSHNLAATGFAVVPVVSMKALSAGFNSTTANLIVGLSCTTTALQVLTFQSISAEAINLPL